jgi:TRAP transporter TAXI family solute receptor
MLGFTDKHLFAAVVAALVIATAIWFALGILFPAPPAAITIAGSFVGGHYESLARRYQELLERGHLDVSVRMTDGTVENLKLLNDPKSGVQIGFVQGGIANAELAPDLLSLGRVDYQIFWLFYPASDTLNDITGLKGKRIALGPVGSGSRIVTEKILDASGVTPENSTLQNLSPLSALKALNDRTTDAVFLNFSPNSPFLHALLNSPQYRPLNFTDAEALTRIFPYLVHLIMPRGVIDYEKKIPANDVNLIATTNAVLVRKDLHPAIVDLLAQTVMTVHGGPGTFHRTAEFPTPTDPEYPVSEEAREYYRNGPSFLNQYLPFWVTNYVKRALAVLVTAIAILLPTFSYAPRLHKWLVEYRLRALYRRLRKVEASLQKGTNPAGISELENELERLDRDVGRFGVPVKHSDLYFATISHLNLVRRRMRGMHFEPDI